MLGLREFGRWTPRQRRHSLHRHRNEGLELVHIAQGHLRWAVEGRVEIGDGKADVMGTCGECGHGHSFSMLALRVWSSSARRRVSSSAIGFNAAASSASVKRGMMCWGQFQS